MTSQQPVLRFDHDRHAELVGCVEADLAAADLLFARADRDAAVDAELARRLADPATPLVTVLDAWADAPAEGRRLVRTTSRNLRRLLAMVKAAGWPGLTAVGAEGADAAWLIAQHADAADAERAALLEPLRRAAATGEADPRHYACLVDRMAAVRGEPQTYGTVVVLEDGRARFPVPVADPRLLEERRTALGLPPVASELPYLRSGDLIPFGDDRRAAPVLDWPLVLEGHRSVEAALEAGVRTVHAVLAQDPADRRLRRVRAHARRIGVPMRAADSELIARMAVGSTHGGVIAVVGPRSYLALTTVIEVGERPPLLVMLDGIEDPHNFGAAVRALYAAGVTGLVVRERAWQSATGVMTRASAGTAEKIPTAAAASPQEAATACRDAGLQVLCAMSAGKATSIADVDLRRPTLILIGGERRGITRSVTSQCDAVVRLDYGRMDAPPLSTAGAAAVIAFEALRQRSGRRLRA